MTRPPASAILLGLAGLLPFLYGVTMIFSDAEVLPTFGLLPSNAAGGVFILERFGAAILGFMGGCLWGFTSSRAGGPSLVLLTATAVPALFAFVSIREHPAISCLWLAFGFVLLQGIDVAFQRAGVAPDYWLSLRLPLTAVVMACLLTGALYG